MNVGSNPELMKREANGIAPVRSLSDFADCFQCQLGVSCEEVQWARVFVTPVPRAVARTTGGPRGGCRALVPGGRKQARRRKDA